MNFQEEKITLTADPRLAIQFASKKEAVAAAKLIGWLAKDATRIEVMGYNLWTIGNDHCQFLTRTGFAYAAHLRGLDYGWEPPSVSQSDLIRAIGGR